MPQGRQDASWGKARGKGKAQDQGGRVAIDSVLTPDSFRFPTLFGSVVHEPEGWTKLFFVTVLFQLLTVVVLTIWDASDMDPSTDRVSLMYAVLLIVSQLFLAFYVFHGCLRDKKPEVYAYLVASLLVTAYEAFDYFYHPREQLSDTIRLVKLIRLAIVVGFEPLNLALGIYVSTRLNRLEYVIGGADPEVQLVVRKYSLAVCWIRFDLQCVLSFLILAGFARTSPWWEMALLGLGLVISIGWAIFGRLMLRRESRALLFPFYFLALSVPAYAGFKVYRLDTHWDDFKNDHLLTYPLFVVLALAVLFRAVVVFTTLRVVKLYGTGLKEHLVSAQRHFAPLDDETTPLVS